MIDLPSALEIVILGTLIGMALFALDDAFIDVLSQFTKAKPEKLSFSLLKKIQEYPEKRIAIMIANWKEEDVLHNMIQGNLTNVSYENYHFFLGVYPNDTATLQIAKRLAKQHPCVHAILNPKNGPTSKGQMLNECVREIIKIEESLGFDFDIFMIHDSEDMIHPLSLKLINFFAQQADFIQLPVFSLDLPKNELIGGTYLDEFGEHHCKEMLVRSKLNQAIPSAGTGTAMVRKLVLTLIEKQDGQLLKEDTLTEDYHLGHISHQLNFKTTFLCYFLEDNKNKKDFISTREYFPKKFSTSLRQKTRWTIGIVFQGTKNLGWTGSLMNRYFLWRDRRGFFNAPLLTSSAALFLVYCFNGLRWPADAEFLDTSFFYGLIVFNFTSLIFRSARRMQHVSFIYSFQQATLVPIRWVLANIINTAAAYKALHNYASATLRGESPKWHKTQHEIPLYFNQVFPTEQMLTDLSASSEREKTL